MTKAFIPAAMLATTLCAGFAPSAQALPVPSLAAPDAGIIQVYGGCGPFGHRGPYGGCRPGGQAGGYVRGRACPPGFHIGPYGRRCWPNR